uniref:Uncharacterized protein n=1 Tax=Utricularia reniformis TaxID=192314 RepID=A0A1Y0B2P8_9LAMI|nr:hypothetical protein AEK19_MT1527 [Utricularia reniformis]ART31716.1 hypothetical protein AEK19_MT1527 [Utricularia reniformis]
MRQITRPLRARLVAVDQGLYPRHSKKRNSS